MIRTLFKLTALAAVLGAASLAHAQDSLPPGPGHDTLVTACSSCHAPEVVADKQMSRAEWEKVVKTMVDRGADATDAQIAEIVAYLTAHYSGAPQPAQPAPAAGK